MISDAERYELERIKRRRQYGCTLRDLAWLIRLTERLASPSAEQKFCGENRKGRSPPAAALPRLSA